MDPSRGRGQADLVSSKVHVCTSSDPVVDHRDPQFGTEERAGELNRLHIDNYRQGRDKEKVEDKVTGSKKDKAAEGHVDSWGRDRAGGRWTRIHRSARRALFTPFKVSGAPSAKTPLKRIRITRSKYLASGRSFKVIEDWTVRANAHRVLEGAWLGTTDFREVAEFIDDDSDEERAQDSAEEPELAARESPSGWTAAGPKQEGEPEHFALSPTKARQSSPATSDASHPEDLLIAAPKNTAGKEKEDRDQPNCSESGSGRLGATSGCRDSLLHPSTPLHWHGFEGECTARQ